MLKFNPFAYSCHVFLWTVIHSILTKKSNNNKKQNRKNNDNNKTHVKTKTGQHNTNKTKATLLVIKSFSTIEFFLLPQILHMPYCALIPTDVEKIMALLWSKADLNVTFQRWKLYEQQHGVPGRNPCSQYPLSGEMFSATRPIYTLHNWAVKVPTPR